MASEQLLSQSSYLEEDIGHRLVNTAIAFIVILTAFVLLRIKARMLRDRSWKWQDIFVPLAYISNIAVCIVSIREEDPRPQNLESEANLVLSSGRQERVGRSSLRGCFAHAVLVDHILHENHLYRRSHFLFASRYIPEAGDSRHLPSHLQGYGLSAHLLDHRRSDCVSGVRQHPYDHLRMLANRLPMGRAKLIQKR